MPTSSLVERARRIALLTRKTSVEEGSDSWCTAERDLEPVYVVLGSPVGVDPCSNENSLVKAVRSFNKEQDGYRRSWVVGRAPRTAYFNPPYGDDTKGEKGLGSWITKAHSEWLVNRVESIGLLPARTSRKVFHELCYPPNASICFIKGRMTFVGAPHPAPFPTCYVLFGRAVTHRKFAEVFASRGTVWPLKG